MAKKSAVRRAERAAAFSRMSDEGLAGVWARDELPFLRAILSDRFNDAPRLIFADWLEERGDPRGEFIRVQCRLQQHGLRDPEYHRLEARCSQLIAKHRAAWMKPYPRLPATQWGISNDYFRRGLPAAVSPRTVASFVQRAPLLIDTLGMTALRLYLASPSEAKRAAGVPQLARIDELELDGTADVDVKPLWEAPLGPIWRLSVHPGQNLRAILAAFLARDDVRALRQLDSSGCIAADLEPLLDWKRLDQLERIPYVTGLDAILDLLGASRLRLTEFWCHLLPDTPDAVRRRLARLAAAPFVSEARHLQIYSPPEARATWTDFVLPPRVRWFSVLGRTTDADLLALLESGALEPVERLDLHGNDLASRAAVLPLIRGERLQDLKRLRLAVSPEVATALVEALDRQGLEHLTLAGFFNRDQKMRLRKKFAGTLEFV